MESPYGCITISMHRIWLSLIEHLSMIFNENYLMPWWWVRVDHIHDHLIQVRFHYYFCFRKNLLANDKNTKNIWICSIIVRIRSSGKVRIMWYKTRCHITFIGPMLSPNLLLKLIICFQVKIRKTIKYQISRSKFRTMKCHYWKMRLWLK